MCVGALVALSTYLAIIFYIFEPPLFIPPPKAEVQSLEKAIGESTDIEGLRTVCAKFARCEDRLNTFQDYHFDQTEYFFDHFVKALFGVIIFFGLGFWRIWHLSKRTAKNDANAL